MAKQSTIKMRVTKDESDYYHKLVGLFHEKTIARMDMSKLMRLLIDRGMPSVLAELEQPPISGLAIVSSLPRKEVLKLVGDALNIGLDHLANQPGPAPANS